MKKIAVLLLILFACSFMFGCDALLDLATGGHVCEFTEWSEDEEATCSEEGIESRYCTICFEEETRKTEKLPHTPADVEREEPTCTDAGYESGVRCEECDEIIEGCKTIAALGHTEVIDPAVEPTETTPGKTQGSHCSVCGAVIIKQLTIFSGDFLSAERYDGNYAYEYLATLPNGAAFQAYYNEIDAAADEFHVGLDDAKIKQNGGKTYYYVAELYFDDNGLDVEEATAVWVAYRADHPLYYWIKGEITRTDRYITLLVDEEYKDGDAREEYNNEVYSVVSEFVTALNGESEEYLITLGFHDMIIKEANYAYEADGVTPSDDTSAHNILGVLVDGLGVCESYAKAFQLLLNYCGIENIYVTGYAGEAHAWNLVCLDDEWYWYDLTWDDTPERTTGVTHRYFCVTDDQNVNWFDGSTSAAPHGFEDDHFPSAPADTGINFFYELPERSEYEYYFEGEILRNNIIEIDGLSYVVNGFYTVCLIKIEAEGDVVIPETITYNGDTYTVNSIGAYAEEYRVFKAGSVIFYYTNPYKSINVTSISIPKTVCFIWDSAFDTCINIREFIVDEDNPYFTAQNGVLFTKSLYTLIKFPNASLMTSYTIPTDTVEIAYNAFGDGGNVFYPTKLKSVTIGSNVEYIGTGNYGRGYRDQTPLNPDDVFVVGNYLSILETIVNVGFVG